MKYFNQIKANIVKGEPRPAWTYRGARRNADRIDAKAPLLRMVRKSMGLSRREHDRLRRVEAEIKRLSA